MAQADIERAGVRSNHHASSDVLEGKYRDEESTALARLEVVRPVITADEAKALEREFQEMSNAIITPDDIQTKGVPRPFPKKSAWRKFGRVFGFSWEVIEHRIGHRHDTTCGRLFFAKHGVPFPADEDCGCSTVYAMWSLRVTHDKSGRAGIGVGICSRRERAFAHQDHDIPMQAFTRALSRAISDLMGLGQPVAGEPDEEEEPEAELTNDEVQAYEHAWGIATAEQRAMVRSFLEEVGYAPGEFRKRGREHLDGVLAMLLPPEGAP